MADDIATIGYKADMGGLNSLNTGLTTLGKKGETVEKKMTSSTTAITNGFNKMQVALAAASSALFADKILDDIDAWTLLNNQLRVVTDSEEDLIAVRKTLNETAEETRSGLTATVELYAAVSKSTKALGVDSEQAADITKTLNNLFLAGGKSAAYTAGAITQLAQGLESGALRGDEFNSVAEGAPRILDAIAESTGIARGELRDFAATGGITAGILVDALTAYGDKAQALADQTLPTLAQKSKEANDNLMEWVGTNDSLSSASGALGDTLVALSENIDATIDAVIGASSVWAAHTLLVGETSVLAYAKNTAASLASMSAKAKETAATVTETEAEIALLTAKRSQLTVDATNLLSAHSRAAARAELTVVTNSLAAAEARLTTAKAAGTVATTALGTATSVLLGPWGLLITALGVGATMFMSTKDESDELEESLRLQEKAVSDLVDGYGELSRAGQKQYWTESNTEIAKTIALIEGIKAKIKEANVATSDSVVGMNINEINSLNNELKDATDRLQELRDAQQAVFDSGMPDNWQSLDDNASDVAESVGKVDKAYQAWIESTLNAVDPTRELNAEIEKVKDAMDSGALSAEIAAARIEQLKQKIEDLTKSDSTAFADQFLGTDSVDTYALSQYQEMQDYFQSINDIMTDSEVLDEIDRINQAIEDGNVNLEEGLIRIDELKSSLTEDIGNPFDAMTRGASEALTAVQGLTTQGSKDYNNLGVAIDAVNAIQAVYAVMNQAGGDPYTAFARMATMASAVASLGYSVTTASGSLDESEYEDIQATQGLNMWGEDSESIAKATEAAEDSLSDLVGINTDMLTALNNLTDAISSASGIITTDMNTTSVNTSSLGISTDPIKDAMTSNDFAGFNSGVYDFLDDLSLGFMSTVGSWLGGSSKVTDSGIKIIGDTISDLIDDTMVQAYETVSYKTWSWGSTKKKTVTEDAGDSVSDQFSLVFSSLADTVYEAGTALGYSSSYLTDAINSFVVDSATISLKGMSTEEQTEALEEYFSGVFNELAESVVPWLSDLQETGEELGTTISRVASEVAILNYTVDNLGVSSSGSVEDVARAADAISDLMGGYEAYSEAVSSFIDSFATDSQKLEIYSDAMATAMGEIGMEIPETTEGFYDLLNGLDSSTESGQEAIATILGLTDTADEYYSLLEDTQDTMADLSDTFASAVMDIYDVSDAVTQVSLDAALAAARLGDFSLAESLDTSDYTLDTSDFASLAEYNVAQAEAANKLLEISQLAANESGSVETEQLDALLAQNELLKTQNETIETQKSLNETTVKLNSKMSSTLDRIARVGIPTYE